MSKLESDAARALSIFEVRKKITTREEKLAQYIGEIERLYNSTSPDYPIHKFMERGFQIQYKSFPSTINALPSIDLVVSIGILEEDNRYINADVYTWIRAEYYGENHAAGAEPIISQAFMLGKRQLGVETDGMFSFLPASNVHVDDSLEYIREAISAIKPE